MGPEDFITGKGGHVYAYDENQEHIGKDSAIDAAYILDVDLDAFHPEFPVRFTLTVNDVDGQEEDEDIDVVEFYLTKSAAEKLRVVLYRLLKKDR